MFQSDPAHLVASEAAARDATDYRFRWSSYIGWTILTLGLYSHYGTYRLVQRRTDHAQRRLAFSAGLWHVLAAAADEAGRRAEAQPGLDQLSRVHATLESYERSNKRNAALLVVLRVATGGIFGVLTGLDDTIQTPSNQARAAVVAFGVLAGLSFLASASIGAWINHILNQDMRFFEAWEDSLAEQSAWVLGAIGKPVTIPARLLKIPLRSTPMYVILTLVTVGLFSIWWRYAMMQDGNAHFQGDIAWEDQILRGLGIHVSATAPPLPPLP